MWGGLLIAVVGGLVGAWAAIFFQRRREREKSLEKARFDIYMNLLSLNSRHFWITVAEIHHEKSKPEMIQKYQDAAWTIADKLRQIDELPEARDILRVIFSLEFESEAKRSEALNKVIDQLGKEVNPRYSQFIKQISQENQALMVRDFEEFWRRQRKIQSP